MTYQIATWGSSIAHALVALSDGLYLLCNQISGRFWLLDNLISLPVYNQLVKAAILGGCFLAVWHAPQAEDVVRRNRRILLVTLLASGLVVAITQSISKSLLLPRPYVQSQTAYHLEGDRLVESPRLPYRVPLDTKSQAQYRRLLQGDVIQNDLGGFPSDHAAFYMTIALGIWLASPAIGRIALGWTIFVLIASRVITGQHSPLDVVAGAGIGIAILLVLQQVFKRWPRHVLDPVVTWTLRHQALASVLIFMIMFEVSNTLEDLGSLIETGRAVARYFTVG